MFLTAYDAICFVICVHCTKCMQWPVYDILIRYILYIVQAYTIHSRWGVSNIRFGCPALTMFPQDIYRELHQHRPIAQRNSIKVCQHNTINPKSEQPSAIILAAWISELSELFARSTHFVPVCLCVSIHIPYMLYSQRDAPSECHVSTFQPLPSRGWASAIRKRRIKHILNEPPHQKFAPPSVWCTTFLFYSNVQALMLLCSRCSLMLSTLLV